MIIEKGATDRWLVHILIDYNRLVRRLLFLVGQSFDKLQKDNMKKNLGKKKIDFFF